MGKVLVLYDSASGNTAKTLSASAARASAGAAPGPRAEPSNVSDSQFRKVCENGRARDAQQRRMLTEKRW
jgi:hypothetical protein